MIRLEVDNQPLDLDPNAVVTINATCPLFDRNAIERVYSFPFSIPATPKNLYLLGHINRLDAVVPAYVQNVRLLIGDNVFRSGVLQINRQEAEKIEVVFKASSLYLSEQLQRLRLRDTPTVITVTTEAKFDILLSSVYPVPTGGIQYMALQINGTIFEDLITDNAGLIAQINAVYPGLASEPVLGQPYNENLILLSSSAFPDPFEIILYPPVADPSIYVFFIVFDTNSDDEAQRIIDEYLDHLTEVADGSSTHVFPVVQAPNIYKDKNPAYLQYVNYVDTNTEHPTSVDYLQLTDGWEHTLIPFFFVKSILDDIAGRIDNIVGFEGAFYDDAELAKTIVWNNTPIDYLINWLLFILDYPDNTGYRHTYKPSFDMADHLPDISGMEFLDKLSSTFCLYFKFKNGRIVIDLCKNLLVAPPEDWTKKAEPVYRASVSPLRNYSLDYDRQSDDSKITGQLERVDGGTDAQEFTSEFYTLFEKRLPDSVEGTRSWLVPYIEEEGQSEYYNLNKKASLRLLFYRGLQVDSYGNDYPLAGHSSEEYLGDSVGNYSLDWSGANGLYEQFWKEYIQMILNGRQVTRVVRLTVADIIKLIEWDHVVKYIYSPQGAMTGIIKQVRFKVGLKGISPAEVEFVKTS